MQKDGRASSGDTNRSVPPEPELEELEEAEVEAAAGGARVEGPVAPEMAAMMELLRESSEQAEPGLLSRKRPVINS